jgi:hypothetical protein
MYYTSNIGLCLSAKVSFICNPCLLELYMRSRSIVFSDWPFFSMCNISSVWSIVLYVCPVSSMSWAYFEFHLFEWLGYVLYVGFYM